jgi:4-hydroxybenzoate polyprenyltransferase
MYNDLEDADDDYHDVDKRERNPVASGEITKRQSFLFNLILLSVGLLLLLSINPFVFSLGIIYALVGFLYSWKTLRLKARPILDLVSHVLFLGVLQFLTTYAAFRPLDLFIVPFLMIIIPFSMMNEIIHEMKDFDIDKKTKINNTVQRYEGFDTNKLMIAFIVILITGSTMAVFIIPPRYRIIGLSIGLLIDIPLIHRINTRVSRITQAI